MICAQRLTEILDRIPSLHIAVVGDFFLDRYLVTQPEIVEVSIETGRPAHQVIQSRCSPGAAGTVTNNLSALGVGRIDAVGVIGDDGEGYELLRGLRATRVSVDMLARDSSVFTPTYLKPMSRIAAGEEEMERYDTKNRTPLSRYIHEGVIANMERLARQDVDAIIIADQVQERDCGVIGDIVREALPGLSAKYPKVLFYADSRVRIGLFRGVIVKPNEPEALAVLQRERDASGSIQSAGALGCELARRNGKPVFLTLSERGILACSATDWAHSPAQPVNEPIDIVGAGDSVTAGLVSALCAGASPLEAAEVGNLCAAVTIRKLGTTGTASRDEVVARLQA